MTKPNCKHHIVPEYLSDLNKTAQDLADMPYDKLAEFFYYFKMKLLIDSENDGKGGHPTLSNGLLKTSLKSEELEEEFNKIWKICKPYMKDV